MLRNGKIHTVQDLLIVVIAEGHVVKRNAVIGECHDLRAVLLLLGVEDCAHLSHGRAHLRESIHKVERRHDGRGHAQRQYDHRHKRLDRQRAVQIEQPAHGQHRQHLRREKGVGHGHTQLTAPHPVVIILCIGPHLVDQTAVGLFALIERLDDLDAVDVLDHRAAHGVRGLDRAVIVLRVIAHDNHHEHERHGKYRQRQKRQPPVQREQIDHREQRRGNVGRHLRKEMRQRRLHALHLIHNDLLQMAAGGIHHRAQRQTRQLGEQLLPDDLEDAERRPVRYGQRAVIQQRAQQITGQHRH